MHGNYTDAMAVGKGCSQ